MRKLILIFITLVLQLNGFTQTWDTAFAFERLSGMRILNDTKGFLYVLGYDWNNSPGSTGLTIAKVVKLHPQNGSIIWEKEFYSEISLRIVNAKIFEDKIYLGGRFSSELCIEQNCTSSYGENDIFVLTITDNGNTSLFTEGNKGNEELGGFDICEDGYLYFTGRATGHIKIGSKEYDTEENTDFFIMKKNLNFQEIWTKIGKTVEGYFPSSGMTIYPYDTHLYLEIGGRAVLENTNDTIGCGGTCSYFHKFDRNGNFVQAYPELFSSPGGSKHLAFTDSVENLYYANSFRFFKDSINGNHLWEYFYNSDDNLSFYTSRIQNVIKKQNSYVLSAIGTDRITRENQLIIIKGSITSGTVSDTFLIKSSYITSGIVKDYEKNKLLVYGTFKNTLTFGQNTLLAPDDPKGYIAILNLSGITNISKKENASLTLHPNPTSSHFTLTFEAEKADVTITDFSGRIMLQQQVKSQENISTIGFSKGIYFVMVKVGEDLVRRKLVVG
jgi:hypothetical protein